MTHVPGRTDLAAEAISEDGGIGDGAEAGETRREETAHGEVSVRRIRVLTDAAAERLGRGRGDYVTVGTRVLSRYAEEELPELSGILARELRGLCPDPDGGVLVVGLGNRELTADAVGPLTALRVPATRQLAFSAPALFAAAGYREISVLAPGSSGQTGIETSEIVRLACGAVSPALVVAVDSLAALSLGRLGATFQLSDAGITPGSGVGNARTELSRRTLGVPVISVGVPTVVSCAVLAAELLGGREPDPADAARLPTGLQSFFVSPDDCDVITDRAASVIADAIIEAYSYK